MPTLASRLNALHERNVAGSRTAARDLFNAALKPILGYLHRTVSGLDDDVAHDCAIEAIVNYLEHPDRFDPARSSLWTYLCMIAERDALDNVRQEDNRERLLEKDGYNIELWGARSNNEHDDAEHRIDAQAIMSTHGHSIVQDASERRVLDLMLEGERSVAVYAHALGLDPETEDVALQVKRVKDRINLRLRKVRDEL
jgi:RNA polymerase sigma-70 factor (ECF subfamily)